VPCPDVEAIPEHIRFHQSRTNPRPTGPAGAVLAGRPLLPTRGSQADEGAPPVPVGVGTLLRLSDNLVAPAPPHLSAIETLALSATGPWVDQLPAWHRGCSGNLSSWWSSPPHHHSPDGREWWCPAQPAPAVCCGSSAHGRPRCRPSPSRHPTILSGGDSAPLAGAARPYCGPGWTSTPGTKGTTHRLERGHHPRPLQAYFLAPRNLRSYSLSVSNRRPTVRSTGATSDPTDLSDFPRA